MTATPSSIIGDLAVETDGLVKTFGATRAVDGVDLAIPRGCVYGVLGPNGAGKPVTELRHSCWCTWQTVTDLAEGIFSDAPTA